MILLKVGKSKVRLSNLAAAVVASGCENGDLNIYFEQMIKDLKLVHAKITFTEKLFVVEGLTESGLALRLYQDGDFTRGPKSVGGVIVYSTKMWIGTKSIAKEICSQMVNKPLLLFRTDLYAHLIK